MLMTRANQTEHAWSLRAGARHAILYAIVGVFAGRSGAFPFISPRESTGQSMEVAAALNAIPSVGAAVSAVGGVAG